MLLVLYPKCTTCQKARKYLEEHGFSYEMRHIAEQNPNEEELREWHEKSGLALKRFFNTSGQVYRGMGLAKKLPEMPNDEQYALLASNGMLVKRPILVTDEGKVCVGFKEKEWADALGVAE